LSRSFWKGVINYHTSQLQSALDEKQESLDAATHAMLKTTDEHNRVHAELLSWQKELHNLRASVVRELSLFLS